MWGQSCSWRLIVLWIGIVLTKVLFIKIHGTVDWSSVITELSLPQRGAKTVGRGWGCLFIWMHLTLKKWFWKKQSMQILVGHGGATNPRLQTPGAKLSCPATYGGLSSKSFGFCEGLPFVNEDTCNKAIYTTRFHSFIDGPNPSVWDSDFVGKFFTD
jgi:hypothetical protein